jgi:hypothetical protein
MKCDYCDHTGIHLCAGRIKAYNDSFTPEQREQQQAERLDLLQKAIEAGKLLKEKYGIEMVCSVNQNKLDYLESTYMLDAVENLIE